MAGRAFLTGDTHGAMGIGKLSHENWPQSRELDKDDYVIVLGDFGLVWNWGDEELFWLRWLEERPWTTLFIDDNHESFDLLATLPVADWHGGKVHVVRPGVYHLMRGYVFRIAGRSFFCMGGARSVDRDCRTPGASWWSEEVPSSAERQRARESLERCGWEVDCVLTHDCPARLLHVAAAGSPWPIVPDPFKCWLDDVEGRLGYGAWYCGHHHVDKMLDGKVRCLYDDIVEVDVTVLEGGIRGVDERWESGRSEFCKQRDSEAARTNAPYRAREAHAG